MTQAYGTVANDLRDLKAEHNQTVQTYEGMIEVREIVISQHLAKLEAICEWAFYMEAMYEDCTYLSQEAFDKDAKSQLAKLVELVGVWVPPELRDETAANQEEDEEE
jgi:hypothetical protein